MFFNRKLLLEAVLICGIQYVCTDVMAQTRITGKLADAVSSEPEIGAVVQVFSDTMDNQNLEGYAVSDSLGSFTIIIKNDIARNAHIVKVSNLGRKTVERSIKAGSAETDLGTILLEDDAETLNSSKVTAAKPLIKMDADKIAYDVESDVDAKASTVLELLRKVPMVTVDGQDNITVNGSSSFKVYVDGKPNQMLSSNPSQIFKSMPASAVQSIEVITNPGAKYDAEGTGGVLNLITARNTGGTSAIPDGANGTVTAGANSKGAFQGGLYANAKKGKLTVAANINAGMQRDGDVTAEVTQESSDGIVINTISDDMLQRTNMLFGDFSASYDHDSLNLFSASLGIQRWQYEQTGPSSLAAALNGTPLFGYDSEGSGSGLWAGLNASADWQHSFAGNKEKMFTLSYRLSRQPSTEDSEAHFDNIYNTSVFDRLMNGKDLSLEHTFQADYTTPVAKGHSISTGAKFIRRHNQADNKFYLDKGAGFVLEDSDDDYHHYNSIAAAYGEYSGSFGQFSLKAGLRYEYTWQNINYTDGRSFSSLYGNLVPNFSLQYNIGAASNIGLTYNLRIRRPGIGYLAPFINRSSTTSISYGNSGIVPEKTHSVMLKYNFFSPKVMVNFSLGYKHGEGGIAGYSFYGPDPEDASTDILQSTYGNIVRNNTVGINYFVNWNPAKDTRIYSSADVGYTDFFSRQLGQGNSGFSGYLMFGAQQTIPLDIRLSANMFGSLRRYNLQGWNSGFAGASLGATKSFLEERLSVTVRGFSNLGTGRACFKGYTKGEGFETRSSTSLPLRQIGVELSWKFGKNNFQVKKVRHSISNDDIADSERSSNASQSAQIQ